MTARAAGPEAGSQGDGGDRREAEAEADAGSDRDRREAEAEADAGSDGDAGAHADAGAEGDAGADARDAGGDDDAPDAIAAGLREARPANHDVAAALARSRVAAALFQRDEPVRIGRYVVEGRLGAGGGGAVFVARDPELSRRVAVKLLHARGNRERLLREGQALARLSHPNVVPVHDAGTLGDQVYVVMELVEGDTLRAHCEAPGRTIGEIVRAYREAGEGLAAAHRAGFLHRDFKPDNALIGRDGRVRVVDFGLADAMPEPGDGGVAAATGAGSVTPHDTTREQASREARIATPHRYAGVGTPRYMAPEQVRGGVALTAAADQYAFCVSLREAVRARAALPRWLDAIVRRGLADVPAARYPSMTALVEALGRDPAWWRRRAAIAAGVLGLAIAAFGIGRAQVAGPSCDAGPAEVDAVWNPGAARRIAEHLTGVSAYGRATVGQVGAMLGRYAGGLRDGYRAACVAHRDGAQSTAMFDRRIVCLGRGRAALDAAVRVAGTASAGEVAGAVSAIGELPDAARCTASEAPDANVAPPPAGIARAVAELGEQLASLEVEVRAARPGLQPQIDAAVRRASALGYRPLAARALRLAGRAAIGVYRRSDAIAPLTEAMTLALSCGDFALAVETFALRLWAAGTRNPASAPGGLDVIQSLAAGLPDAERTVRALLDNAIGSVELAAGHRDRARPAFERAVEHARGVTGPAALELAELRSNLALVSDDPVRRRTLTGERIAIVEAGLGADHPLALDARIAAARLELDPRAARAGLEPACDRLAELHPDYRVDIRDCQCELGWLAFDRGDMAAAQRAFGRAVAAAAPGDPSTRLAIARGYAAGLAGDAAAGTAALSGALAALGSLDDAAWYTRLDAGRALLGRGAFALAAGLDAEARRDLDAARVQLEMALAVSRSVVIARVLAFARASLVRSWHGAALPPAARAHADAAIAWYREAGGYDAVVAELERSLGAR